jgi:hypothetical protein
MQQVSDWLGKLGMAEYAQRFADNDIDFSILRELTDQDLEKIGVASLGHRRKILKAIAALNGPAATAAQRPPPSAAKPAAVAAREPRIRWWAGTRKWPCLCGAGSGRGRATGNWC